MATWQNVSSPTIDTGATLDKVQINYVSATQALNSLAELSNYWWKIDKDGQLYFKPREAYTAPISIDETIIRGKPTVQNGNQLYRNVQYIKGGSGLTNQQIETETGDGETRSFKVGYSIADEPLIEVNTGSGYVEQTIGPKGQVDDKQFYWEKGSPIIVQDSDETKLTSTDLVRITYIGQFPSIFRKPDNAAITEQQSVEGNSTTGQVEKVFIEKTESQDEADQLAGAKLTKYAQKTSTLKFQTQYSNFESGQLSTVNLPNENLDAEDLLITRVSLNDENAVPFYTVEAVRGPRNETWSDFFGSLKQVAETSLVEGLSADQTLVLPFNYSKTWTDADKPNIFRQIYPDNGGTWSDGFNTALTWNDYDTELWSTGRFDLFPASDLYPSFLAEDRVKYISFWAGGSEVFRKRITQQEPPIPPQFDSVSYISPDEYTGTIDDIKWYGGFRATNEFGTGVLIDTVNFNGTKNALEAYQITRTDIKDGDY